MRTLCIVFFCLGLFFSEGIAGTIGGRVAVNIDEKPKRPRRYYMGPYRSGSQAKQERRGARDVVVYIAGAQGMQLSASAPLPVMRQKDERFIPHVLPVRAGASVSFPNEDDFYHNVFSVMAGDRFDLGRYARGETIHQTFTRPGVVVVRCEIHPGMKAYVRVLESPCFTVPNKEGAYTLPDIPAGTYTLKAWHPTQGEQTRSVTVPDSGVVEANFVF